MNKKGSNPQSPENMLRPPPPPEPPKLRELREGSEAPVRPKPEAGKRIREGCLGYVKSKPVWPETRYSKYHDTPLSLFVSLCIALVLGGFFGFVYTFMYFVDKIK